jgi:hypothetical protein
MAESEIGIEKVAIEGSDCDKDKIIDHLRNILSNVNYSLNTCCCCGWIDHEDKPWKRCNDCGDSICEHCYKEYGSTSRVVYCYGCDE